MQGAASKEKPAKALGGLTMLLLTLVYVAVILVSVFRMQDPPGVAWIVWVVLSIPLIILVLRGLFVVNPNTAKVLVLLGKYRGTVRQGGFHWTNPFANRHTISLKAHNVASSVIKVNDTVGNPIEIGAVVVWRVRDTAQAMFDVEDFHQYVDVQIETAVRQLASQHPYDDAMDCDIPSLREDTEQVTAELQTELQRRLERAGIDVIDARLSHLAYAPEIASAMLQRQQATAIIAARRKIVEGAVGMVEDALQELGEKQVLILDDERRATLVGNLLVVLCGHNDAQPVINTGSLYT
jgi:regulator of protease activity HflC (stomatin/prohibitin superfamily)